MTETEIAHYVAGVVPMDSVTLDDASALLCNRGAVRIQLGEATIEAHFNGDLRLNGLVSSNGKLTAFSVTTRRVVYLLGEMSEALGYIDRHGHERCRRTQRAAG